MEECTSVEARMGRRRADIIGAGEEKGRPNEEITAA